MSQEWSKARGPRPPGSPKGRRVRVPAAHGRRGMLLHQSRSMSRSSSRSPNRFSFAEAAGVPLAALTAWQALLDAGGLKEGQTVLIHGGSGGVGAFAVQIAKAKGRRSWPPPRCESEIPQRAGADVTIDYATQKFEEIAKNAGGIDVVLDTGGDTQKRSFEVLKKVDRSSPSWADWIRTLPGRRASTPVGFPSSPTRRNWRRSPSGSTPARSRSRSHTSCRWPTPPRPTNRSRPDTPRARSC